MSFVEDKHYIDNLKCKLFFFDWEKSHFCKLIEFQLEKEEEVIDFEDLGIIEVDDEEWNEYDVVEADNSRRKIPNLK